MSIRRTKYGRRTWGRATALGLDDADGRWVVTCEDHATIVNVDTAARARTTATTEFCEDCSTAEHLEDLTNPADEDLDVDYGWADAAVEDARSAADLLDSITAPPADDGVDYGWAVPADLDALSAVAQAQHAIQSAISDMDNAMDAALDALGKGATYTTADVVETLAWVQEQRRRLADTEKRITTAASTWPAIGRSGQLSDGREYEVKRTTDRKAWDHDAWKHDARAAVVKAHGHPGNLVNPDTGELVNVFTLLTDLQEFHGSTAPRVGTMRKHDLDPDDYCETNPGGWTIRLTDPTEN